jgi:TP901 family phage tail tape measure protein
MATTLGEAIVKISASLKPLKKNLRTAKSLVRKAVSGISSRLVSSMSSALGKIGAIAKRTAKIITVALVGAIALSIREAAKFQKQMASVNTMLDKDSEPLMASFTKSISEMSKTFGQSTQTLTQGLYDILSASIPAEKALDVLGVAATAAIAGVTDTGIAADVLTTVINSYGMAAEDAASISDKLFATVKRGKTTFPELAQSLGRVTSTASIAGLGLNELLATVATLTRSGIQTTEAVTSINGVLRAFLSPQDDAIEAAKEFGLELSSNTLKTVGFLGSIQKLNGATAEQLATIVPNIRAFKALAGALNNVAGLQTDVGLISQKSAGKTQEAFEKMADTTSFKLGKLKESTKAVGRAFGEPLLKPLDELVAKLNVALSGFEAFIRDNSAMIRGWGDYVKGVLGDVGNYFLGLLSIIKDEGWGAALAQLGVDIKKALGITFEFLKPLGIELGGFIADGFMNGWGLRLGKKLDVLGSYAAVGRGARRVSDRLGFTESSVAKLNPAIADRPISEELLREIARNTRKPGQGTVSE